MTRYLRGILVPLLCFYLPAHAQDVAAPVPQPASAEAPQVLEVSGVKDPEWKPYRRMLKGLDAFDAYRQQLAPQADLRFVLRPNGAKMAFADVSLRIAGAHSDIAIAIAPDGTFVIPRDQAAADDNAEMVLNQKKNAVRWRVEIHTPNLPEDARRLGDLRLTCRVGWAVLKDDAPFLQRAALAALGGPCATENAQSFFAAPHALASATLVQGERRLTLQLGKDNTSYTAPLADAAWGNDALVLLAYAYAAAMPAAATAQQAPVPVAAIGAR